MKIIGISQNLPHFGISKYQKCEKNNISSICFSIEPLIWQILFKDVKQIWFIHMQIEKLKILYTIALYLLLYSVKSRLPVCRQKYREVKIHVDATIFVL